MRRVISGSRKLMYLKYIEALDEGYGEHNGIKQPATLSNLAAFLIQDNAVEGFLERNFDYNQLRKPVDDEVVVRVQREAYNNLRGYYGQTLLSKDTVTKTKENHVYMRTGRNKRNLSTTSYSVTRNGEKKIESLESYFEEQKSKAESSNANITYDTIRFPIKKRNLWEIKNFKVPRVVDGICIDTKERVSL